MVNGQPADEDDDKDGKSHHRLQKLTDFDNNELRYRYCSCMRFCIFLMIIVFVYVCSVFV